MRYKANQGGHAPGYLREAFEEFLDSDDPLSRPYNEPRQYLLTEKVIVNEKEKSFNWLLGQLWNCTDVLPGDCCSILDVPQGSSFAQAVRDLKDSI